MPACPDTLFIGALGFVSVSGGWARFANRAWERIGIFKVKQGAKTPRTAAYRAFFRFVKAL
jgi:hypothetical protein